jgi:uncharacterized protein involved in response to NO
VRTHYLPARVRAAALRLLRWPVWQCALRPFFLATAVSAVLPVLAWLVVLAGGLPAPDFPGGAVAWHAPEMLLGFGLASVAGFVLTAIPEFTQSRSISRRATVTLLLLWLSARATVLLVPWCGAWPLALIQSALCLFLLIRITPPIWRDPTRRQRDLWAALAAVLLSCTALSLDLALGNVLFRSPQQGLRIVLHLMLLLIVATLPRISLRVVNRHLEEAGAAPTYVPRPPRRHVAVLLIGLHALAVALDVQAAAGWLALGAGATCLGLLSDWPHTRILRRRWVVLLYTLPWLLGLGYLLDGASRLGAPVSPGASVHLHAMGALGVAVFSVLCIAGRTHVGLALDERRWLPAAALLLFAAAMVRTTAEFLSMPSLPLWWMAGLLWALAYGLWLVTIGPDLIGSRDDGGWGCAGPSAPQDAATGPAASVDAAECYRSHVATEGPPAHDEQLAT